MNVFQNCETKSPEQTSLKIPSGDHIYFVEGTSKKVWETTQRFGGIVQPPTILDIHFSPGPFLHPQSFDYYYSHPNQGTKKSRKFYPFFLRGQTPAFFGEVA